MDLLSADEVARQLHLNVKRVQALARGDGWRSFAALSGAIAAGCAVLATLAITDHLPGLVPSGPRGAAVARYVSRDSFEAAAVSAAGVLVFLGVGVGGMLIAMYLPIFDVAGGIK